jgi:hypothetical protein
MAAPERFAKKSDSFPLHRGRRPYMAAPERFAKKSDSFPLHRGRRPYMAHLCRLAAVQQIRQLSRIRQTWSHAAGTFHNVETHDQSWIEPSFGNTPSGRYAIRSYCGRPPRAVPAKFSGGDLPRRERAALDVVDEDFRPAGESPVLHDQCAGTAEGAGRVSMAAMRLRTARCTFSKARTSI